MRKRLSLYDRETKGKALDLDLAQDTSPPLLSALAVMSVSAANLLDCSRF